ncbi:MAG: hypothetical protein J6J36_04990 [Clostridia bacterium]|nr:hypothetical protein [Clostridia bacterium]
MFFVFSKDKIISYIVSFSTVMILLGIAFLAKDRVSTIEVMSEHKDSEAYVNQDEITLTIDCNGNIDSVNKIIEDFKKSNLKVTFIERKLGKTIS